MNETRHSLLDRFYHLLGELEQGNGGKQTLAACRTTEWLAAGVYFFFETGELRDDGISPRVVRVGTHGLKAGSQSTLWKRLSQHRGTPGGSMPGGGNHRGSIFRLHVGTALLAAAEWPESIRRSWGHGSTASRQIRQLEYPLERAVTNYIESMPFLWVSVDDPPGPTSARGVIETGSIGLLSNYRRPPIDAASPGWLGRRADRVAIGESGLWNINHINEPTGGKFLDELAERINLMAAHRRGRPMRGRARVDEGLRPVTRPTRSLTQHD